MPLHLFSTVYFTFLINISASCIPPVKHRVHELGCASLWATLIATA